MCGKLKQEAGMASKLRLPSIDIGRQASTKREHTPGSKHSHLHTVGSTLSRIDRFTSSVLVPLADFFQHASYGSDCRPGTSCMECRSGHECRRPSQEGL